MRKFNEDEYFNNKLNKHLEEQEEALCHWCGCCEDDCECDEFYSESEAKEDAMWDKADAEYEKRRDES